LKVIKVQHQHSTATPVSAYIGELAVDLDAEAPLVVERCERIVVGKIFELTQEMFALGDVVQLHDQGSFHPRAVGVGWRNRHQPPGAMAIGMLEAFLEGAGVTVSIDQAGDLVLTDGDIVAVHQLSKG